MKHFSSLRTPESIRFRNFNKFSQFLNLTLLILRWFILLDFSEVYSENRMKTSNWLSKIPVRIGKD